MIEALWVRTGMRLDTRADMRVGVRLDMRADTCCVPLGSSQPRRSLRVPACLHLRDRHAAADADIELKKGIWCRYK